MKKNNFFVVGSPFQLLCAVEAIEHFILNNYVIIAVSSAGANRKQMLEVINLFGLREIYWIDKKKSSFFSFLRAYFKYKIFSYENGFIGENGLAFRSLCFSLKPERIFLLDDGISVIRERRRNESPDLKMKWRLRYGKIRFYRYFLFGMRVLPPVRIGYFSSILKKSEYGEIVIHHGFENVSSKAKLLSPSGGVISPSIVYVDTGLLEHGMDGYEFRYLMDYVVSKYKKQDKIGYRPHRFQDMQLVAETVDANHFHYVVNSRPIELDFILYGAPDLVIGTISSALVSLKAIFPDLEVVAIDLRSPRFKSLPAGELDAVYEQFLSYGILLDSP